MWAFLGQKIPLYSLSYPSFNGSCLSIHDSYPSFSGSYLSISDSYPSFSDSYRSFNGSYLSISDPYPSFGGSYPFLDCSSDRKAGLRLDATATGTYAQPL